MSVLIELAYDFLVETGRAKECYKHRETDITESRLHQNPPVRVMQYRAVGETTGTRFTCQPGRHCNGALPEHSLCQYEE